MPLARRTAETISIGDTVKRASDIAFPHAAGITLFAADAEEELEKITANSLGSQVYFRLIVENSGAYWPLTRKFSTSRDKALALMGYARSLGLVPGLASGDRVIIRNCGAYTSSYSSVGFNGFPRSMCW